MASLIIMFGSFIAFMVIRTKLEKYPQYAPYFFIPSFCGGVLALLLYGGFRFFAVVHPVAYQALYGLLLTTMLLFGAGISCWRGNFTPPKWDWKGFWNQSDSEKDKWKM